MRYVLYLIIVLALSVGSFATEQPTVVSYWDHTRCDVVLDHAYEVGYLIELFSDFDYSVEQLAQLGFFTTFSRSFHYDLWDNNFQGSGRYETQEYSFPNHECVLTTEKEWVCTDGICDMQTTISDTCGSTPHISYTTVDSDQIADIFDEDRCYQADFEPVVTVLFDTPDWYSSSATFIPTAQPIINTDHLKTVRGSGLFTRQSQPMSYEQPIYPNMSINIISPIDGKDPSIDRISYEDVFEQPWLCNITVTEAVDDRAYQLRYFMKSNSPSSSIFTKMDVVSLRQGESYTIPYPIDDLRPKRRISCAAIFAPLIPILEHKPNGAATYDALSHFANDTFLPDFHVTFDNIRVYNSINTLGGYPVIADIPIIVRAEPRIVSDVINQVESLSVNLSVFNNEILGQPPQLVYVRSMEIKDFENIHPIHDLKQALLNTWNGTGYHDIEIRDIPVLTLLTEHKRGGNIATFDYVPINESGRHLFTIEMTHPTKLRSFMDGGPGPIKESIRRMLIKQIHPYKVGLISLVSDPSTFTPRDMLRHQTAGKIQWRYATQHLPLDYFKTDFETFPAVTPSQIIGVEVGLFIDFIKEADRAVLIPIEKELATQVYNCSRTGQEIVAISIHPDTGGVRERFYDSFDAGPFARIHRIGKANNRDLMVGLYPDLPKASLYYEADGMVAPLLYSDSMLINPNSGVAVLLHEFAHLYVSWSHFTKVVTGEGWCMDDHSREPHIWDNAFCSSRYGLSPFDTPIGPRINIWTEHRPPVHYPLDKGNAWIHNFVQDQPLHLCQGNSVKCHRMGLPNLGHRFIDVLIEKGSSDQREVLHVDSYITASTKLSKFFDYEYRRWSD